MSHILIFDDGISKKTSKDPLLQFKLMGRNILTSKYNTSEAIWDVKIINDLIFNEKCRIVARFKDFLIYDDTTENLRRFYNAFESQIRLDKVLNFYHMYSKIFPNYIIIPESVYLYKNIRRKQKMIDACNMIKQEEEENRKKFKDDHMPMEELVFDKNTMESILRYQPSTKNLHSYSIIKIEDEFEGEQDEIDLKQTVTEPPCESNVTDLCEESNMSIAKMLSLIDNPMTDKGVTDLRKNVKITSTGTKLKQAQPITISQAGKNIKPQGGSTTVKKFISHKMTSSVPQSSIKIINNYQNIIIPQGSTLININNNYFNCKTLPTRSESPNRNIQVKSRIGASKLNGQKSNEIFQTGSSKTKTKDIHLDKYTHTVTRSTKSTKDTNKTKTVNLHNKILNIFKENYKTISNSNSNFLKFGAVNKINTYNKSRPHQSDIPDFNRTGNLETERIETALSKNEMKNRVRNSFNLV